MLLPMLACAAAFVAAAQPAFEVATIKPGSRVSGRDGTITTNPGSLLAHDVNIKRLVAAAYQVPYDQISGAPGWLDSEAFDLSAKAGNPSSKDQLMQMLQTLLAERFHLALHSEMKEKNVYALVVGKNGPKLNAAAKPLPGVRTFHGDLQEFAAMLTIQLSIPISNNPSTPSRASGAATPVIDKTGIAGIHDIGIAVNLDPGEDTFGAWQRALQEQLGLRLETQKGPVRSLIIDHVEKLPS